MNCYNHPLERPGTCKLDLELRYVEVSPWLAHLHGLSVFEHIGMTVREILPDMADMVEVQLQHVLDEGTPLIGGQAYAETPAHPGVLRLFEHDFVPVKDEAGRVVGVICAVQDVTQEKLAKDIQRARDEMQRLEAYELAGPPPDG